jgi:hypothetical protein
MSTSEETRLFVYGKLLEEPVRRRLLGRTIALEPATLPDYQRRLGRYFYIIKIDGARTPGSILDGLSAADFEVLDRFEDVPRLYLREKIDVLDAQGASVRCWIYLPSNLLLRDFG